MNIVNNFDKWLKNFLFENKIDEKDINFITSNVIKKIENNGDKFKYIKAIVENEKSTNKKKKIYKEILLALNEYKEEFKLKETKLDQISFNKYYSKREISIFANNYNEQRGILVDKNSNLERNIVRNVFAISSNDDKYKDEFEKNGIIYFSPLIQKNSKNPWNHFCNKELMKINRPDIDACIYFFSGKETDKYNFMGKYYFFDKHKKGSNDLMILKPLDSYFDNSFKDQLSNTFKKLDKNIETLNLSLEDKKYLAKFRINQTYYRRELIKIFEGRCLLTNINDEKLLIASHIKPYCKCNDNEKVDPYNGLILSALADKLFDKGLISFAENGDILYSESLKNNLSKIKDHFCVQNISKYFNEKSIKYFNYHREFIFIK